MAEGVVISTAAMMKGASAQMAAAGDTAGAAKAAKGARAFGLIERLQSGPTFDYAYPPIKPELTQSWLNSFFPKVGKPPSWPGRRATFSILPRSFRKNAWANLHLLGQPK